MKSSVEFRDEKILMKFESEKADRLLQSNLPFKMNEIEIFFDLDGKIKPNEVHPDLLALSAILLCNPFVGEELYLPVPVSEEFHKKAQSVISRYKLNPNTSPEISSISKTEDGFPGLAFSGGADSSAALAIMPSETIPIFLNRPIARGSSYNSEAPLEICKELSDVGYDVQVISTNLEYIRTPVGFPTDLANAIPAILLSEFLNLDSLAFGTIMESGFGLGHSKFIDYGRGAHWRFYSTLFGSVGVELSMPVIGVSEIGTAIIGEKSPLGHYSQSCIRGGWGKPCMRCWKCFRKELLSFSLGGAGGQNFLDMMKTNEVQKKLSEFPISHENVIVYALQRIDLDDFPYLKPIADKLDMSIDLSLLETWYPGSIDFVPSRNRHSIREKILDYLPIMSPSEENVLTTWDMRPHLNSEKAKRGQEKLTSLWQDLSIRFG